MHTNAFRTLQLQQNELKYRKTPNPGLIFFKGPFRGAYLRRSLYSEGLIYGGKFAFQNQLGKPYSWTEIYRFCFVLLCIWQQFPSTRPRGAYIWRGDLMEGFLCYEFGELIFGGAYFQNSTVFLFSALFMTNSIKKYILLGFSFEKHDKMQ